MNLIVAVDSSWGIGRKGHLLFRIREDMKRFRRLTVGKTIVVGRKTVETFPDKKPLPDRRNIVLSRNPDFSMDGADICWSLDELFDTIRGDDPDDILIVGGDSLYEQLLPYCEKAFVTHVEGRFDADAFFPNLLQHPDWELDDPGTLMLDENRSERTFRWATYRNSAVRPLPDPATGETNPPNPPKNALTPVCGYRKI